MRTIIWRHLWIGGIALALIRAAVEMFRLVVRYPVVSDLPAFMVQISLLYVLVIGIGGGIIASVLWRCFHRSTRVLPWLPLVWFLLLAGFDFMGFASDLPTACRMTQGMPPQHRITGRASDIVLISLDTCRADSLGAYGNPEVRTPILDRLSLTGALAEDAVTSIPVTTPAHASLLTGFDPPRHGSRFNAVPVDPAIRTLAETLRDCGYATGGFISAFPVTHDVSGLGRGFDVFDQLLTPDRFHPLIYRSTLLAGFGRFSMFRPAERKWFRTISSVTRWWASESARPRFTWVHFYDPHFPYEPRPIFRKMYCPDKPQFDQSVFEIAALNAGGGHPETARIAEYKALYLGEISSVDHAVEELVRALFQSDRFKDTIFVVVADHGESLDEHNYYFSHGENLYDPSLKIPLLIAYPGVVSERTILPGQYPLHVVPGMIHSLLDIPMPDHSEPYRQTVRAVHDAMTRDPAHAPSIKSYCESGAGVYTTVHVPRDDRIRRKKRGIRTHRRKLILHEDGTVAGYDLDSDPQETQEILPEENTETMALFADLTDYIRTADPADRQPPHLPAADAIERLRALGYISE